MLNTLGSNQRHIINQLPDIHIRNGRVLLNQMQPHVIRKEDGTPVAIIDTTGSMNFIYNEHVNVLLTETKLIVRRGKYTFNTLDLAQVEEFDLTKDVVYGWIQKTWGIVTPMTYAIFLLMSYIFTAMVMLLIATVGLFISSAMHTSLRFSALLRIGAAAATPSIILITVFSALEIPVPRLLYIACILVYLLMGIRACRPSNEKKDSSVNLLASLHDL
jgi:hypothetical protein